jgi:hypothetical protein
VVGLAASRRDRGYAEVEIFSQEIWDAPADGTAATVRQRFSELLGRLPRPTA